MSRMSTTSLQQTSAAGVGSPTLLSGSPTLLSESPQVPRFGRERFLMLRQKWLTPMSPPRPVPVDQLDEDTIIDAITDCPGDVLEPPVHLPYMAEALAVVWEEEGLYN